MSNVVHHAAVQAVEAKPERWDAAKEASIIRVTDDVYELRIYDDAGGFTYDRISLDADHLPMLRDLLDAILTPPAPSPVEPGAYVPKVGDVVMGKWGTEDSVGAKFYRVKSPPTSGEYWTCVRLDGSEGFRASDCYIHPNEMRPATPAERVAAGLDKPAQTPPAANEAGFDEADRKAANLAYWRHPTVCDLSPPYDAYVAGYIDALSRARSGAAR